ncbi:MAG: hypothetical protein SFX73_17445 [Kofleriaceae bacterium]|nr:hypothetical protein [Kofleriaceae bacterium]
MTHRGIALLLALAACGKKQPIAELTKADGPVERQPGTGAWTAALVGTKYFLGDAARTADGGAELVITGGAARIAMQPHTVLRFGGSKEANQIAVELGAVDLMGSGQYGLDVGDVKLTGGTVRIAAKAGGGSTVTLQMGDAVVTSRSGQTFDLDIGGSIDLGDVVVRTVADAQVVDAAVAVVDAAEPDAAPPIADGASFAVTGKKVEILLPGETKWQALPEGAGALAKGAKIRLGAGSTAKLTSNGTTLDMAGSSRAGLSETGALMFETGSARASVPPSITGKVGVPGGEVVLEGTAQAGAEARLDVNGREAEVAVLRGGARLVGSGGGTLELNRGETASVAKVGTIRVVEAIPGFYDFQLAVGNSALIHDPKGNTAIQFSFGGKCAEGGFIEMDRNAKFQTAKVSSGKDGANMMVGAGSWSYRLRCTKGGGDTGAVASGRVTVLRDGGNRPIPKNAATNEIRADGRPWTVSYQSVLPSIAVPTKGTGGVFKLHVASGGTSKVYEGKGPKIVIPSKDLAEGNTYTFWLEKDGVKDPKVSSFKFEFDNTTPQVYIQEPVNGKPWAEEILVRGAVLAGWSASVNDANIPIDAQRRFTVRVPKPTAARALSIRLSHPQRGVHYYLRRGAP